jgi:hypothetical protein
LVILIVSSLSVNERTSYVLETEVSALLTLKLTSGAKLSPVQLNPNSENQFSLRDISMDVAIAPATSVYFYQATWRHM